VERKNAVESYVYDTRAALSDYLEPYITEADRDVFSRELSNTEDWLYGEGEHAKREAYIAKLAELKKYGDPVFRRRREDEEKPHAIAALEATLEQYKNLADTTDPKYEHISAEDRGKIKDKCKEAAEFVFAKIEQQNQLPKTADPIIQAIDISQWRQNVERFCAPIMNKPKPAPPKEEKKEEPKPEGEKKEEPKPEGEKKEEPKDGEAAPGTAPPQPAAGEEHKVEMDIDN